MHEIGFGVITSQQSQGLALLYHAKLGYGVMVSRQTLISFIRIFKHAWNRVWRDNITTIPGFGVMVQRQTRVWREGLTPNLYFIDSDYINVAFSGLLSDMTLKWLFYGLKLSDKHSISDFWG